MKLQEALTNVYFKCSEKASAARKRALQLASSQTGASTVEYALLIAVIVFGVVGAAAFMIPELKTMFLDIVDKIAELALG